ncbi:MAG: hypothetical protein JWO48_2663, partial [Bryobacterales bacterium]|nr:hypothetical protein [Bryobacterales bacterium]
TFTKYAQNPVLRNITEGNRDPKVIWHEPTKQWVMTLYVGYAKTAEHAQRETIQFFTSPNLKDWTQTCEVEGYFECPDFFPLAVDGDAKNTKWVLTAASSDYMVGSFDGKKFVPETPKLKGHRGRAFYAAQTFSDLPAADGRRIQIGWFQAPAPGMPFNQAMTVPLELKLLGTSDGPRLSWTPVKELESLRGESKKIGPIDVKEGDDPLAGASGELLDMRMDFEPGQATEVGLDVRGVAIRYDVAKQELSVNDHKAPAPLRAGHQRLIVLADRNCYEIFASDGLTYVPFPVIPKANELGVRAWVKGGTAKIHSLEVNQLRGIWNGGPR